MPEDVINVAVCLGLTSIVAAAVLSGQDSHNPVVVEWPKPRAGSAALRLHSANDVLRWGNDAPLEGSDCFWGLQVAILIP